MTDRCHSVMRFGRRAASALLALIALGCGSSDYEVADAVARRPGQSLDAARLRAAPLRVPDDTAFNLAHQSAQQDGGGRAAARADPAGTAVCNATCSGPGTAVARFQLGHRIDVAAGASQEVLVTLEVKGIHRQSHSEQDQRATGGTQLWCFIRDTGGQVLRKELLMQSEGDAREETFHLRSSYDVALAGELGYYVVLSGRATANGVPQGTIECGIEVTALKIEVTPVGVDAAPASAPTIP